MLLGVGYSLRVVSVDSNLNVNWGTEVMYSQPGEGAIGQDLVALSNGNFVAIHGVSSQNLIESRVVCLNPQGQILWNKAILGSQSVEDMCPLPGGKIAILGRLTLPMQSCLMVLNSDGTVDWVKRIEDSNGWALGYDLLLTNDGNLITTKPNFWRTIFIYKMGF